MEASHLPVDSHVMECDVQRVRESMPRKEKKRDTDRVTGLWLCKRLFWSRNSGNTRAPSQRDAYITHLFSI